ncbi:Hypothetical protein CINCED_3A022476 [Cinara cedri]|uniref:Double jelly roll-like domain-containing protein n=1 Tax=Cinara cedri TaxID=506608 RepID=A0A5E4MS50_9HEMI|nr:Hypothetical protein CINCED_3A022476 [Cinara cedri]
MSVITADNSGGRVLGIGPLDLEPAILYYCDDTYELQNAAWDVDTDVDDNKEFMPDIKFSGGGDGTNTNFKYVIIELGKVHLGMPIAKVNDREKSKLLKVLDSRKPLTRAFRTWDLSVIGFRTDRKNNLRNPSGRFDNCSLKNLKVHLNSEVYPYENFRADFTDSLTAILYGIKQFRIYAPLIVVDLMRQDDSVQLSTVDLRVEFETQTNIVSKSSAYCLILRDQIIAYNPFNGDVRKL